MSNFELTIPETFISGMEEGRAIYTRWREKLDDQYGTAFFIQEEKRYLN